MSSLSSHLEPKARGRSACPILAHGSVNWVKWTGVIALGALTLVGVALVHTDNRRNAAFAIAIFATAVAVTIIVIATEDRPFSGPFRVTPKVLLQVLPPRA